MWLRSRQSRIAMSWNPNVSDSTIAVRPSHRGMSTQTNTSGCRSRSSRSSAGQGFTPNSLTR